MVPRILTIWFDFNSIKFENNGAIEESLKSEQDKANIIMAGLIRTVPPHSFYIALPQLISRVGHNNEDTVEIVKAILKRVLAKFPRHAMWPLAWLLHSADPMRSACGEEIFKGAQRNLKKTR